MKNHFIRHLMALAGLAVLGSGVSAQAQQGQKYSLGIEHIHCVPALSNKWSTMPRILQTFDTQLMDRFSAGRKFEVRVVSDLDPMLNAAKRTGQAVDTAGQNYGVVTTLDDFEDSTEKLKVDNETATKRRVRLNVVVKVYDISKGSLYESANIEVLKATNYFTIDADVRTSEATDVLLIGAVKEAAQKVADRVTESVFPAKVIAKTGKQVTINRGDAAGAAVGQEWEVFAPGKILKDPDTGEELGREEVKAGKVRITSAQPKFSNAEIVEGGDAITEGMVLRRAQAPRAP